MHTYTRPSGLLVVAAAVAAVAAPAVRAADAETEALEEQAFKQAAALVNPSVVRIQTVGGLDRVGRVLTGTGPTTGVVVSEDGYIISSAFNFISKPASILVQLPDGRRFSARQVATDRLKMLTLLKIEADGLKPAQAAEKDSIRVGQWAIAIGRTYDLQFPSISVGIVSALNRIWGKAIQTDAKVSPVNYGGPLVDVSGKVMGILVPLSTRGTGETAGVEWYDSGIGFAIPLEDAYAVLDRLKAGEDLYPGLMGIAFEGRNSLSAEAEIGLIRAESPADKAGLKKGDVVVAVDGRPVTRQAEVKQVLGTRYAGETMTVTVKRGEETIEKELTLVEELVPYESAYLGILPVRESLAEPAAAGATVRYVFADSPAEKAGLQVRDRLLSLNDQPVVDADTLRELVSRLRPGEKATMVYLRDDADQTVEIELTTIPNEIPAELPSAAIPASREPEPAGNPEADASGSPDENNVDEAPRTGRFTVDMPNHEHTYWAYVPEGYNPDYEYGLMVWIHPDGDTMEAAVFRAWRTICQRRGIMIIGPKAAKVGGWTPNEAEFVSDAVRQFTEQYPIDPDRVFLHTYSTGGRFAYTLGFKYRELFHGMAAASAPLRGVPAENDPDYRMQFHVVCGDQDNLYRAVQQTVQRLRQRKFPTSFTTLKEKARQYPPEEAVREMSRWVDMLDRI